MLISNINLTEMTADAADAAGITKEQTNLDAATDEVIQALKNGKTLHGKGFRLPYFNKDKSPAFQEFYKHLCQAIRNILLELKPGLIGTLREICDEIFWGALKNAAIRRLAGKYVADMVKKDLLPLEIVGRKSNKSLLYKLT